MSLTIRLLKNLLNLFVNIVGQSLSVSTTTSFHNTLTSPGAASPLTHFLKPMCKCTPKTKLLG